MNLTFLRLIFFIVWDFFLNENFFKETEYSVIFFFNLFFFSYTA